MRPIHRWSLVALAVALAVLVPMGVRALPVHAPALSATDLLARIQRGDQRGYSGTAEVEGRLGLPVTDHFTDVADLLGGDTTLRVWWRDDDHWRVDKLLPTGEDDLFHHGHTTTSWDYERDEAQSARDPAIRLPRDSDLLPPALARRVLTGADPGEVTSLGARRIAGHDVLGLRLRPTDPRTSIDHVDVWADPGTGLVLALAAYDDGNQPALRSEFTSVHLDRPALAATTFHPATGVPVPRTQALDLAAAADQYAPVLPPTTIAGLPVSASTRGAVGVYGSGVTQALAVPLQSRDARYLAYQLRTSGAQVVGGQLLLRAGPLGIVLTFSHQPFDFAWLLTGTLTDPTLVRAARALDVGTRYRG